MFILEPIRGVSRWLNTDVFSLGGGTFITGSDHIGGVPVSSGRGDT